MEFSEEFALIQGCLISAQNIVGELKSTSLNGDDFKIKTIFDAIKKTLSSRGIHIGNEQDKKQDTILRRIHMFLVLNTDLLVQEELLDDINCGHVVDCAPTLSKDLLLTLVWRLSLHKYMCETIIYCPFALGIELLDAELSKIEEPSSIETLSRIEDLAKAVYCKYIYFECTETSHVKSKLFKYFKTLLQYFVKPNSKLCQINKDELYCFAGIAMKFILSLTIYCLKLYLNPLEQGLDMPEEYCMSLSEVKGDSNIETVTSCDFLNELFLVCKVNFCAITVNTWLFWSECSIEGESDENRTLQVVISEAMYYCCEELNRVQIEKAVVLPHSAELISMLSSMAVKPRDEDDDIKEADMGLITQNVLKKSKTQYKWLKALLGLDEVISEEKCRECLKNTMHLMDYEDVKVIIEKTIAFLTKQLDVECYEEVRQLSLDAMRQLPLSQQVDIVEWFFKTFEMNIILKTDNFDVTVTEVLNKAINVTENKEKFLSDFVILCMQAPVELITKVIYEGLKNSKQMSLVIEILELLKPVCTACEVNSISDDGLSLVLNVMNIAVKSELTDQERTNFLCLSVALVNHNIVDGTTFYKKCLLPALYDSLSTRRWSLVLLWLEVLNSFTDGTMKSDIDIHLCPLLVMLAQVLEVSRWSLVSFTLGAVSVCEEALCIVKRLVNRFLDTKHIDDKEVKWLQKKLSEILCPLNKSYFSKLWTKFNKEWTVSHNTNTFLLDVMQSDNPCEETKGTQEEIFKNLTNKRSAILLSLSKLLPLCITTEWKVLVQKIKEISIFTDRTESPVALSELIIDSLLLLLYMIEKNDIQEDESVLSCLDYTSRNLALVLKAEVIPQLKLQTVEEQAKIINRILHFLGQLPSSIRESCSILMVNVLVELLPLILNDSSQEDITTRNITGSIGLLGNGESSKIMARKMLESLRLKNNQ